MASFSAARSFSRSAPLRRVVSDLAAGTKAAARPSVRLPKSPATTPRFLRNPVEMSSCLESLLPLHSVTASALMTSLISVSPRTYGWFSQGLDETK